MNINIGEITLKELVNIFGTEKQKKKINNKKYLGGREKDLLLIKAKKFCDIENLTKSKYLIHKVYDIKEDDPILPLTKGLNKYLVPLILSRILEESEDGGLELTLSFLGWAKKFEMINDNYSVIKYNQEKSAKELDISPDVMFEYFEKIDDCIRYYIDKCLYVLKDKNGLELIDVESVTMVSKIETDIEGLNVYCDPINEPISSEDRKFVYKCEQEAKDIAHITKNQEKYYGFKSHIYRNELRKLLKTKNILFTYEAYNIYCKDINETKKTLSKFEDINNNPDEFINLFTEYFIDYIEKKAINRHNKELLKQDNNERIKSYRILKKYISDYRGLSELTISKKAENMYKILNINPDDKIKSKIDIILKKPKN